jgi:putative transposase
VFTQPAAFEHFLFLLLRAKRRYPSRLYHYCLMSNHIHFLLQIDRAEHLPKLMQGLLQGYGRWYKHRQPFSGHLWQGRYKSPLVSHESYFLEAGRYIERNPLRAKLVADLKDYRWSSYPVYAHGVVDPLVDEDPYYALLAKTPVARQQAYQEFVRLDSPYAPVLDAHFLETAF